jgi:UDP-N-acetylmuramyl pentapeptide synthase
VSAGDAFIALRGARHDGAAYVDEAARRGARVVLFEQGDAV